MMASPLGLHLLQPQKYLERSHRNLLGVQNHLILHTPPNPLVLASVEASKNHRVNKKRKLQCFSFCHYSIPNCEENQIQPTSYQFIICTHLLKGVKKTPGFKHYTILVSSRKPGDSSAPVWFSREARHNRTRPTNPV